MRARQQTVSAWSEKTLGPLFEQTKRQKERERERERAIPFFLSLAHFEKITSFSPLCGFLHQQKRLFRSGEGKKK